MSERELDGHLHDIVREMVERAKRPNQRAQDDVWFGREVNVSCNIMINRCGCDIMCNVYVTLCSGLSMYVTQLPGVPRPCPFGLGFGINTPSFFLSPSFIPSSSDPQTIYSSSDQKTRTLRCCLQSPSLLYSRPPHLLSVRIPSRAGNLAYLGFVMEKLLLTRRPKAITITGPSASAFWYVALTTSVFFCKLAHPPRLRVQNTSNIISWTFDSGDPNPIEFVSHSLLFFKRILSHPCFFKKKSTYSITVTNTNTSLLSGAFSVRSLPAKRPCP